jgi:hypothetical protein
MLQASQAKVEWNAEKKHWHVTIQVGAEAIKRLSPAKSREADDDSLRAVAVQTAHDEGYELEAQRVSIVR